MDSSRHPLQHSSPHQAQAPHLPSSSTSIHSTPGSCCSPPSPACWLIGQTSLPPPPPLAIHPQQSITPSSPSTAPIPLDPFLTALDQKLITSAPNSHLIHPSPTLAISPSLQLTSSSSTPTPRLPKTKLIQTHHLNHAAQRALNAVWDTLSSANALDPPQLEISRNLDCLFGELHASAVPFKQDALALIWPQSITNKSLKASFNTRKSPAYFSIRRANIAFVAEYILYAMPGEEAYGKNDIVFACEGFLPLVLDPELVLDPQSWKLFNELKIQIYIQRLDQSGADEANSRVLPNLFVESLSSYSGLEVPSQSELEFDKLATETKQELVTAAADLELLRSQHPYNKFATWALEFLRLCADRVDREERDSNQLDAPELAVSNLQLVQQNNQYYSNKKKQRRQPGETTIPASPPLHPHLRTGSSNQLLDGIHIDVPNSLDISVEQTEEEEYGLEGELGPKGRYNPYRLGRGKGPSSAPRRRWTQEEYDLLLEEVRLHSNKYDCMAQIIKRHGKNGELSEILRDQNNVSLKDKARNLTMEWQRHGYPEDKPWLKEAFARFSVKNFKRSSNRSMPVDNKEDENQVMMNIEIDDERRESRGNRGHDVNVELRSDGSSYLNHHLQCSAASSSSRISPGLLIAEIEVQIDDNIPVMASYENQRVIDQNEQVVGGEASSSMAGALVHVEQPDPLAEEVNWNEQRNQNRAEGDPSQQDTPTHKIAETNQRSLHESYQHPIHLDDHGVNLPIEFEIHPNLLVSSTEAQASCLSSDHSINPSFTSVNMALEDSTVAKSPQSRPNSVQHHLDHSKHPALIDQLLDPNLLS